MKTINEIYTAYQMCDPLTEDELHSLREVYADIVDRLLLLKEPSYALVLRDARQMLASLSRKGYD